MSYLVLSRKFRPPLFSAVAGQEHVTKTLERALETGRIGQAYLFSGPRGIGKTTVARILAKALNCHEGVGPVPCNKCPSCLEISKSSSVDVFEIDGASNRRIEEVRDLRENVKFSPARDRFKIYIIDEVHMLTQEAFNALLKTLEEPPDHVKFIFATTAPKKIPLTIISRCQRFELKRIPATVISDALFRIAREEKIEAEKEAVEAVASLASGSMRDAQSIFDQLACSVDGPLTRRDVDALLGLIPSETFNLMCGAAAEGDVLKALEITGRIIDEGKDVEQFVKSWLKHWRDILMVKSGCPELTELPENEIAELGHFAETFSREEILEFIRILFETDSLVKKTSSSRIPLELAAAEIAGKRAASPARAPREPEEPPLKKSPGHAEKAPAADHVEEITIDAVRASWPEILEKTRKESVRVHGFLLEGTPTSAEGGCLNIAFSKKFHMESCEKKENRVIIEKAVEDTLHRKLSVTCVDGGPPGEKPPRSGKKKPGADAKKKALDNPVVKEVSEIFKVDVLEVREEKKS